MYFPKRIGYSTKEGRLVNKVCFNEQGGDIMA